MANSWSALRPMLDAVSSQNIKLSTFLVSLLSDPAFARHQTVVDLVSSADQICAALCKHSHASSRNPSIHWAAELVREKYSEEIERLVSNSDWKFSALHATAEKIEGFKMEKMAQQMQELAPHLWDLIGTLLSSPRGRTRQSKSAAPTPSRADDNAGIPRGAAAVIGSASGAGQGHTEDREETGPRDHANETQDGSDEEDYWDQVDDIDLEGEPSRPATRAGDLKSEKKKAERRNAILTVKKVVVISLLMQSKNQKANALQSVIGIFLHSSKTPEKVIETLARAGISISLNTIHLAITSLSAESTRALRALGKTLLASYAYDNFDVDLKSSVPTAEKSGDSLKHLTSAIAFPLQHGVTLDDLNCSEELWKQSPMNKLAANHDIPPAKTWKDLLMLHPEAKDSSGMTRRDRFNSWKFLYDLCHHGPEYFAQFQSQLGGPEIVEKIPDLKTPIIPTRAMDVNNSTVLGNISAIAHILEQAGVGDILDPATEIEVVDMGNYVIIFHGDLGTGERIFSVQLRRSIEDSPWNRFQYIVFVPGLFHVKMACADAIWRVFIQPVAAREDETSLMRDIAQLRPTETGTIASKPGFRRMHQVIGHAGICRRLDCWRMEASRYRGDVSNTVSKSTGETNAPSHDGDLEFFAASRPSFEQLKVMADRLALQYVADGRLGRLRRQPAAQRDQQYENALLLNKYTLLYEELSYAMNNGDIGRVETCLIPWTMIFKATGKHKYATHLTKFLCDIHFVYPAGLRRAVRYHMLLNTTGKSGGFRGVDWHVELNNLWTKADHGGEGPNRTVERIIKESPLVQTYRDVHSTIEKNFALNHLTVAHTVIRLQLL